MGKTIEGLLLKFQTEKLNLMGLPNVADRLPQRLFYFRLDSNILKKIGVRTFSISIKLMKMAFSLILYKFSPSLPRQHS